MSQASRRTKALLLAAVVAAMAIVASLAISSSHREAPNIMLDPAADNTDVYAWTAPDAEGAITIASDWIPGQVPANGPNFFRFDDRARYYNNIDNNGDGVADIRYRFTFNTKIQEPELVPVRGSGYAGLRRPGAERRSRPTTWSARSTTQRRADQTSNEDRATTSRSRRRTSGRRRSRTTGTSSTRRPGRSRDGTKLFVGTRDEPFFVDLGAAFDAINVRMGTGNQGGGKDDLSGYCDLVDGDADPGGGR